MFLSPLFDSADIIGALVLGMFIALGMIIFVVPILESIVLRLLKWGQKSYLVCLATSYGINIASALVGIPLFFELKDKLPALERWGIVQWLIVTLIASVLTEWGMLCIIHRKDIANNLKASVIINIASYIIWVEVLYLFRR